MENPSSRHRDLVDAVHTFNVRGQIVPPSTNFNADRVGFYTGMQLEELAEKLKAIGEGSVSPDERSHFLQFATWMDNFGKNFKSGLYQGNILRADREALLDGDIDQLVVSLGSAMYQTPNFRHAIDAVLGANDAKKFPDGEFHHDANGKIIKPEGWIAPDLSKFIVEPNT